MEAMSFGIPVVATDAGATREIVNATNGLLLPVNFDQNDLLKFIDNGSSYIEKRHAAYETWRNKYNSQINYMQLVQKLKEL